MSAELASELLCNVIRRDTPFRCITLVCSACGKHNHVTHWQVFPLPGCDDGATAVTCYVCEHRERDIPCSAVVGRVEEHV